MKTLFVSTWGDPKRWEKVPYRFDGSEKNGDSFESETPTKVIQENKKPDETIVLVLDSLSLHLDIKDLDDSDIDYSTLSEEVESHLKQCYIRCKFGFSKKFSTDVWVLPAKGRFGKKNKNKDSQRYHEYRGDAMDFYHVLLYKMAKFLCGKTKDLEHVIIDVSQGINFAPVITYKIIQELVSVINIFKKSENVENSRVRITVYNSDPYSPGSNQTLDINEIIADEIPEPMINVQLTKNLVFLEPSEKENREETQLSEDSNNSEKRAKEMIAFVNALTRGCPLVLSSFYPDRISLNQEIEKTFDRFIENISVKKSEENGLELVVNRKLRFTSDFRGLVMVWFLAELLKEYDILENKKEKLSLAEMEKMVDNPFSHNEFLNVIVSREIMSEEGFSARKDIKNKCKKNKHVDSNSDKEKNKGKYGSQVRRNFISHVGLLKKQIEVDCNNPEEAEKILVWYKKDLLDEIMGYLSEGFVK